MAKCIEREAFLKGIEERYCLPCKAAGKDHNGCKCRACWVDDMCGEVIDAPAADVAPVVHGRWIGRKTQCWMFITLVPSARKISISKQQATQKRICFCTRTAPTAAR